MLTKTTLSTDTVPNMASSLNDLMGLEFRPNTLQGVQHPTRTSPLASGNGYSSFHSGFQEAHEEEEEEEL